MGKVFLIDVARCNGCHNCQVACKDEHCGQAWPPYAESQPETGQFWCKVEEEVHGTAPKVNVTYTPHIGGQSQALLEAAGDAAYRREDGLVILDPAKAQGRRDLAEAFPGVFWNEELNIPQTCTGCAHLLDDGWDVPRCVDSCPTEALRFGDESDFADELAASERLDPTSCVHYLNLPKRWVAGEVYDPEADEVVIGAKVTLANAEGTEAVAVTETDDFGDFWFRQVEPAAYTVWVETEGYLPRHFPVDAGAADVNAGPLAVYVAAEQA